MRVGELKDFIIKYNIPDDALILYAPSSGDNICYEPELPELGYVMKVEPSKNWPDGYYKTGKNARIPCVLIP